MTVHVQLRLRSCSGAPRRHLLRLRHFRCPGRVVCGSVTLRSRWFARFSAGGSRIRTIGSVREAARILLISVSFAPTFPRAGSQASDMSVKNLGVSRGTHGSNPASSSDESHKPDRRDRSRQPMLIRASLMSSEISQIADLRPVASAANHTSETRNPVSRAPAGTYTNNPAALTRCQLPRRQRL